MGRKKLEKKMTNFFFFAKNFRKRYFVYYRKTGKNEFTITDFIHDPIFDTQLQRTIHKENSSESFKVKHFISKYADSNKNIVKRGNEHGVSLFIDHGDSAEARKEMLKDRTFSHKSLSKVGETLEEIGHFKHA